MNLPSPPGPRSHHPSLPGRPALIRPALIRPALIRPALIRPALLVGVMLLALLVPRSHPTYASTASSTLPLTTAGVHFGMVFNNNEPTVNGAKPQESNVDYVYGADGGMHNVPANPGHPWHDKYLSWSRDAAAGASEPISWYQQYHPDWLLYKADQTTIPLAMNDNVAPLDFTNPAVQQYIVTTWINPALAGGFQGVVFDNDLGFNYLGAAGHYTTSGTWVQQYTGSWSDPTYANAQAAAFQQIVALVHASHPTATVGINQGVDCNNDMSINEAGQQYADIVTDEEGFTNSANTSLPYVAQYANTVCPNGKWLTVMQWAQHLGRDLGEGLFILNPEPYAVTADMTDSNSQARFDLQWVLANYLLITYAHTYLSWGDHQDYGQPLIPQHEYQTVQAIGSPTDDFYASQQVYMRDFSNGLAVVNPSRTTAYTVGVPAGTYQDLYGTPITTVSLPAHSGLVLLDAPASAASSTPCSSQNSIALSAGWNLLGIPTANYTSAASLASEIESQNPGLTVQLISRYVSGRYVIYVPGVSSDLPLGQGEGVEVLTSTSGTWIPQGSSPTNAIPLDLSPGWNLVSVPYPGCMTAAGMLGQLSTAGLDGQEAATVSGGAWQIYLPSGSGTSFAITPVTAVMVLVGSGGSWSPQ